MRWWTPATYKRALFQILINCLDVVGASRGAIYVTGKDGGLMACASHGLRRPGTVVDLLLADREFLERLAQVREPVELHELLGDGVAPRSWTSDRARHAIDRARQAVRGAAD